MTIKIIKHNKNNNRYRNKNKYNDKNKINNNSIKIIQYNIVTILLVAFTPSVTLQCVACTSVLPILGEEKIKQFRFKFKSP